MDVPKIEVAYDVRRRRLNWTMRGFWSVADVAEFDRRTRAALAVLGPPPYQVDGLCIATDYPVQSQEVNEAFGEIYRLGESVPQGRLAIVVGSVISKLQAERASTSPNRRVFLSPAEAEEWLDAPREAK